MVASVGDVELSPLLDGYRAEYLVSCEFLLAKLLFAGDQQLIHRLQLGLKPGADIVAVEWLGGTGRRDDSWRRWTARGEIAESADEELLNPLIGFRLGLGGPTLREAFAEDHG